MEVKRVMHETVQAIIQKMPQIRRVEGRTLAGWRNRLSYVSQDPFLSYDTVRRNLTGPSASEDEIGCALEFTGAAETVHRRPLERDLSSA